MEGVVEGSGKTTKEITLTLAETVTLAVILL
jgi:hypothetical protein